MTSPVRRAKIVRQLRSKVVVDYLDFLALPNDSEEAWAEASVAMLAEFAVKENRRHYAGPPDGAETV
jgi:hypothetical protein